MAEQGPSVFNKKATEKLRSPDALDKYVRVTTPSVWAVLLACVALLLGLLAWGVFGSVSTSATGTGVVLDGRAVCFLPADDAARLHKGDAALVGGTKMRVAEVASIPLSRDEASEVLDSDYLVESFVEGSWACEVTFDGDVSALAERVPLKVNVTCERVAPHHARSGRVGGYRGAKEGKKRPLGHADGGTGVRSGLPHHDIGVLRQMDTA